MADEFAELYETLFDATLQEPRSAEEVKNVITCIRTSHGHLDIEDESELKSASLLFRKKISALTTSHHRVLGKFTRTICQQLYDNPNHFFFELVQNADDAQYSRACNKGSSPWIRFRVSSKQLVVETNEDGFTLADVRAICATGESSKSGDSETTGEKGFGFKAVFAIAKRVHVRSGLWSFRFEHDRYADGMGMICPIFEEAPELPPDIGTRFIIDFSDTSYKACESLCTFLEDQPGSIVFALRRLNKVAIVFEDVAGRTAERVFETSFPRKGLQQINTTISGVKKVLYLNSWQRELCNMPTNDLRPNAKTYVKIGFPISSENEKDQVPSTCQRGQHIFAFLPVQRLKELPILIHADFILPASRQAISDNAWNRRLRGGVAELFTHAVSVIVSKKNCLSYQWMQFLPKSGIEGFWRPLRDLVKQNLSQKSLYYSYDGNLSSAASLRRLPSHFLHEVMPLLPPGTAYKFLSQSYKQSDFANLADLGVSVLSCQEMLERIIADHRTGDSISRKKPLHDTWHTSCTALFSYLLEQERLGRVKNVLTQLGKAEIIPVRVGRDLNWRSVAQGVIYFPHVVNQGSGNESIKVLIPYDLGWTILDPTAAEILDRAALYRKLGVTSCSTTSLCGTILRANQADGTKHLLDLVAHFELLYWFSYSIGMVEQARLWACTAGLSAERPARLYLRSNQPFDSAQVLNLQHNEKYGKHFLHQQYQLSRMSTQYRGGRTWEMWLTEVAGIRRFPPLLDEDKSDKLHWILDTVRIEQPLLFLPMIQTHWETEYKRKVIMNTKVQLLLASTAVACANHGTAQLRHTWLPTSEIMDVCRRYEVTDAMPILDLPQAAEGFDIDKWSFLSKYCSVSATVDLALYLRILTIIAARPNIVYVDNQRVRDIYASIGKVATFEDQQWLKDHFLNQRTIWNPTKFAWWTLNQCVWQSPVALQEKLVIATVYGFETPLGAQDAAAIRNLFRGLLQVGDADIQCLIDELVVLRDGQETRSSERMRESAAKIYEALKHMVTHTDYKKFIRSKFHAQALIFANGRWHKTTQCVWHATLDVHKTIPIAGLYHDLKEFFVDLLGVQTVTDTFMMAKLAEAATKVSKHGADISTSVAEIRNLMSKTSTILSASSKAENFQKSIETLREAEFLPCKTPEGDIRYVSLTSTFYIVDHDAYGQYFQGKLALLVFDYQELNSLHQLFRILGLEHRYLTRWVRMETSEGIATVNDALGREFRACAYALSCCAVFHQSPAYSHRSETMHQKLLNASIATSPDMRTEMTVTEDKHEVKVKCDRVSLVVRHVDAKLEIILPTDKVERRSGMRSDMPGRLADLFETHASKAEKQIYRILNEIETGTDEILVEETIPHAPWLRKTERIPELSSQTRQGTSGASLGGHAWPPTNADAVAYTSYATARQTSTCANGALIAVPVPANSDGGSNERWAEVPTTINHEIEAPQYYKVLEHVRRQAKDVFWRDNLQNTRVTVTSDLTRLFEDLSIGSNSLELWNYPALFGNDSFTSKFRIGAAGELFIYEMLRSLACTDVSLQNWRSRIRHFVQAHNQYADVGRFTGPETADITYVDTGHHLESFFRSRSLGDAFPGWAPSWLEQTAERRCQALEWLFEVKATTGPCETPFFMYSTQYERMRAQGSVENQDRTQVYCIVRVYNLLKDKIGLRIFIDPWRLREQQLEFGTTDKWRVKTML